MRVRNADTVTGGLDTVAGYRPVSPWAVAAVVVGSAAALALASPLFWLLPLVGAAVSWVALVDTGRRDAPRAGRLAALAGLALSLGFGTQAVTATATSEWLARGRAEAAARFWLATIAEGRLDDARVMCLNDAAAAVAAVADECPTMPGAVRYRGRDAATGARIVRATVADRTFDVVLAVDDAPSRGAAERFVVVRCAAVTPSGS